MKRPLVTAIVPLETAKACRSQARRHVLCGLSAARPFAGLEQTKPPQIVEGLEDEARFVASLGQLTTTVGDTAKTAARLQLARPRQGPSLAKTCCVRSWPRPAALRTLQTVVAAEATRIAKSTRRLGSPLRLIARQRPPTRPAQSRRRLKRQTGTYRLFGREEALAAPAIMTVARLRLKGWSFCH